MRFWIHALLFLMGLSFVNGLAAHQSHQSHAEMIDWDSLVPIEELPILQDSPLHSSQPIEEHSSTTSSQPSSAKQLSRKPRDREHEAARQPEYRVSRLETLDVD